MAERIIDQHRLHHDFTTALARVKTPRGAWLSIGVPPEFAVLLDTLAAEEPENGRG